MTSRELISIFSIVAYIGCAYSAIQVIRIHRYRIKVIKHIADTNRDFILSDKWSPGANVPLSWGKYDKVSDLEIFMKPWRKLSSFFPPEYRP